MNHLTWVYHPTDSAKIVDEDTAKGLYKEGWFDCPAKAADYLLNKKQKDKANKNENS